MLIKAHRHCICKIEKHGRKFKCEKVNNKEKEDEYIINNKKSQNYDQIFLYYKNRMGQQQFHK